MRKQEAVKLKYWHSFQILLGILFSLLVFSSAYGNEALSSSKMYSRYMCSALLLSFSLAHLFLLISKRANLFKVFSFLPLYLAFGFVYQYASIGYIKNWAPHPTDEALQANIIYGSILVVILLAWLFSVFYETKITHNKFKNERASVAGTDVAKTRRPF